MTEIISTKLPPPTSLKQAHKRSLISSLCAIALAIAFIILGEKILYDINRWLNPARDQYGLVPSSIHAVLVPTAHAVISLPDKGAPLPSFPYTSQDYETYRLLLHAAVIIPLFLLMFLFYYFMFMRFKKASSPYRIISYAYIGFAFWLIVRLLGEFGYYMIKNYKTVGVYTVLVVLIAIFTVLIMAIQKRMHAPH